MGQPQEEDPGPLDPWGLSYSRLNWEICGGLSPIVAIPIQMAISQAWNGVFQKFKNLKSSVWHALHIAKGLRSTGPLMIKLFKKWFSQFLSIHFLMSILRHGVEFSSGGYLFGVFILACCQYRLPSSLTAALPCPRTPPLPSYYETRQVNLCPNAHVPTWFVLFLSSLSLHWWWRPTSTISWSYNQLGFPFFLPPLPTQQKETLINCFPG